jgi:hypothetical protein
MRVGGEGYIAIHGVHMLRQDMRDGPCHASGQSGNDLLGTDLVWGRYAPLGWDGDMPGIIQRWSEMRLDWRAKFRWLGGFDMLHVVSQATEVRSAITLHKLVS